MLQHVHLESKTNETKHRASTTMYSLAFRVRVMLP